MNKNILVKGNKKLGLEILNFFLELGAKVDKSEIKSCNNEDCAYFMDKYNTLRSTEIGSSTYNALYEVFTEILVHVPFGTPVMIFNTNQEFFNTDQGFWSYGTYNNDNSVMVCGKIVYPNFAVKFSEFNTENLELNFKNSFIK